MQNLSDQDREDMEWGGILRLIEGILLHVLDMVSISGKWKKRKISMKTLLLKLHTLKETGKWMKTWQWSVWVNIHSIFNNGDSRFIKKRFENIRRKSIKEVKRRIHEQEIQA